MTVKDEGFGRKEIVGWIIQAFSALALMVGAWFFSSVTTKLEILSVAVNGLTVNVAVMAKNEEKVTRLESRVEAMKDKLQNHSLQMGHPVLDARVKALEVHVLQGRK